MSIVTEGTTEWSDIDCDIDLGFVDEVATFEDKKRGQLF